MKEYHENQKKARALLKEIETGLDRHEGLVGDRINWGHVGDLSYVVGQLEEIKSFLDQTKRGEV